MKATDEACETLINHKIEKMLEDILDYSKVCACGDIKLFIHFVENIATNVFGNSILHIMNDLLKESVYEDFANRKLRHAKEILFEGIEELKKRSKRD